MPAVEPTCTKTGLTEGKRCSECGEVLVAQETVPALGRTTESGTCERCGQPFGDWRIDYYVDDFNQPTDEWYITEDEYLVGTFSNSATTNSKLYANVMVDLDDNVMIFLYEYGSRQVKNSSERYWDEYNITMRTPDGADHKITGTMYCGDDEVNIDDAYIDEVLTALNGEGNVMFRIENADRTDSKYRFGGAVIRKFSESGNTLLETLLKEQVAPCGIAPLLRDGRRQCGDPGSSDRL